MPSNLHPRSFRTSPTVKLWGVGTATYPFVMKASENADMVNFRGAAYAGSGYDTRVINARLYFNAAGGGDVIRAYAFCNTTSVATGGTMTGIHATASIAASSSISGQATAGRFTLEAAAATRSLSGTLSALIVDSNIGANNTLPATHAFVRFADVGSVALSNLMIVPTAGNGLVLAAHTTQTMTHSIKILDAAGTAYYIMCTAGATNRS